MDDIGILSELCLSTLFCSHTGLSLRVCLCVTGWLCDRKAPPPLPRSRRRGTSVHQLWGGKQIEITWIPPSIKCHIRVMRFHQRMLYLGDREIKSPAFAEALRQKLIVSPGFCFFGVFFGLCLCVISVFGGLCKRQIWHEGGLADARFKLIASNRDNSAASCRRWQRRIGWMYSRMSLINCSNWELQPDREWRSLPLIKRTKQIY